MIKLKQFAIISMALLFTVSAHAQKSKKGGKKDSGKTAKNNLDIVYDVQKDVPLNNSFTDGNLKIMRGGFYKVELRNINKFLYLVKIDNKAIQSDNSNEQIARSIFNEGAGSELIPFSTETVSPEKISSNKPYVDATLEKYLGTNPDTVYMERMSDATDNIRVDLITQAGLGLPAERGIAMSYYRFKNAVKKFKADVDNLEKAKTYYREMLNILKTDNKPLDSLLNDRNTLTTALFGENNILALKLGFIDKRSRVDKSFDNVLTSYASLDRSNLKGIGVPEDAVKEMMSDIKSLKDRISDYNYFNLFEQITNIYNAFNPKNFTITEVMQIPDVDKYSTSISIAPNSLNKTSTYKKTLKYDINVEGGYKVDFSSGFFFNFLISDKGYHYENAGVNNGVQFGTIKEDKDQNDFLPSIGFLVHVYKNVNKPSRIGGCFGLSTNNAENLKYMLGASLFLGDLDRFIINAGVAGGAVNLLDGRFEKNKAYAVSDLNSSPATERVFKLGAFVGVSYNLTNKLSNKSRVD